MAIKDLMERPYDTGFLRRIAFLLFDVARDKAPVGQAPSADDLKFIAGVLNGEVNMLHMATAVVVVNADALTADDVSIKTTIEAVWPFFAAAWATAPRVS